MTTSSRSLPPSSAPPRQPVSTMAAATLTAVAALVALAAIGTWAGHLLLIPPMAASMALIAGAPSLPLSQPRNVVGGQVVSALVGAGVGLVNHSLWAGAVAGGLALGATLLMRMPHSPAAATAVIGATIAEGQLAFTLCVGLAAVVLVLFGLAQRALKQTEYPTYWW